MSSWRTRGAFAFRVLVFAAVVVGASQRPLNDARVAARLHSPFGTLAVVPFATVIVATVRGLGFRRSLHIHDRHVDVLVAIALAGAAIATTALFGPRLWWAESVFRFDVLARPLWIGAAFAAVFGARPLIEHLPTLGVLGTAWPTPYALIAPALPADAFAPFILAVIVAATTAALLTERYLRQIPAAAAGALAAFFWCESGRTPWVSPALAVLTIVAVSVGLRWQWLNPLHPIITPDPRPPAVQGISWPTVVLMLPVAFISASIPGQGIRDVVDLANTPPSNDCQHVDGWTLEGRSTTVAVLGHGSPATTTRRCRYRLAGRLARSIAVDVTQPAPAFAFGANPLPTLLPGPGRLDPVDRQVVIDGGRADVYDWNDPTIPTELLVLSWYTRGGSVDRWRRVSVLVPDDRRSAATIPEPDGNFADALKAIVTRLGAVVRTRRAELHQYGVEPKDLAEATRIARELVEAWKAA